ncbi:branched-chain amino acid ABC transporter permease [Salipaludibacillus neizhouensis]|uniref:Branched-chain amino acid ABC transporter permease n=1 Tax=Salipaludibacillus neizhouensis TaxID=885475 RepID=A0A3A9K9N2_9BACI|nr:AzlC family ABC transporter permease [Salipaludibacillus neizhouensis]RKL66363.1 branched-chain amino acid ABC transporter permease [Salipaludibacillus neizhouensis]
MSNALAEENIVSSNPFKEGLKAGIPVAIGYIPIAIAFGLLAKSFFIPEAVILLMSLVIFAGASQFIGINLIIAGVAYWEIIITTFILNLRHFLMTASLSQRLPKWTSNKELALLSFGVTDETFSVSSSQRERVLQPSFVIGINLIAFLAWNVGTWAGVFLAMGLPASIQNSMGIALYAMFIGLLVPSLKESNPIVVIVGIAIVINAVLYWVIPMEFSTGWMIIITTILTATIGVWLFPKEEGEDHE